MTLLTSDCFSRLFADRTIAVLFLWQIQQRSVIGFVMIMFGKYFCHILLNAETDGNLSVFAPLALMYTALLDELDGKSFMSYLLYPGIRPGSKMALASVQF